MEQTVSKFLKLLNVPISERYVQNLIHAHPDFPSLLSVSDSLQRLGVHHAVRRIRKEDLIDLIYPYLLPLDKGKRDILLIKSSKDLAKHENNLELWGGVVLQAEPSSKTNDKTNNDLYKSEIQIRNYTIGFISAIAALLLLPFISSFSWLVAALLGTAITGFIVGYILMTKELGVTYEAIDAFCNAGKNTNCDKVLKADINFLGLNFSDVVVTYFLFQMAALAFAAALPDVKQTFLAALAVLSMLTYPAILFSIYYQYFVAKTWCRLCLIVDVILLVQASVLGYAGYKDIITLVGINLLMLIILALLALVIFSSVLIVKASIERFEKLSQYGGSGNQIKHNVSIFTSILGKQRRVDTQPFQTEMILGNADAPIKIIMASNLYCNPCKKKHEVVEQLVAMYPDKVSVAMRFIQSGNDVVFKMDSLQQVLGYWYQYIHGKTDKTQLTLDLMHDWFTIWDLQKFEKKYQFQTDVKELEMLVSLHYAWTDEVNITSTPAFFINGYELPNEYSIDDLFAMAPSLADMISRSTKNEMTLQNT